MPHPGTTGTGVIFETPGVEGDAPAGGTGNVGVLGKNAFNKTTGFLAGTNPFHNEAVGAYGESDQFGVLGIARTQGGIGVFGTSVNGAGIGIRGDSSPGGFAAQFVGPVDVKGPITHDGVLTCTQTMHAFDFFVEGGDCAEDFEIIGQDQVEPGTVMVLDSEGALTPSCEAYDKKVAGVISGAGRLRPGVVLDRRRGGAIGNR
jgi:hypothetical protein